MDRNLRSHWYLLLGCFAFIGFVIYGASLGNSFVRWDDGLLIYENPAIRGFSLANLKTIFTTYDPELYIPLTLLSYQFDFLLSGTNPAWYHFHSLILHILNATLVVWVLKSLTKNIWVSLLTGVLFLIHPLHTEAIAWASGRKDLLSTLFFLLSTGFYLTKKKRMSLAAFTLGLLAKVTIVTLPITLLLIDYYKGEGINKDTVKNKIPYFVLALLFAVIAYFGKSQMLQTETLVQIIAMAGKSTAFYLEKLLWPTQLSVLYPYHHTIVFSSPDFLIPFIGVSIIGILAILSMRYTKIIACCLGFFAVTLAPSLPNFAKAGTYYIASDRYAYIPSIGFLLLLSLGIYAVSQNQRLQKVSIGIVGGLLVFFSYTASVQSLVWKNSETLFTNVIQYYPDSHVAHNNIGNLYRRQGKLDEATDSYRTALSIRMGSTLGEQNIEAIAEFETNIANALATKGDIDQAILLYNKALSSNSNAVILSNLGSAYRQQGKLKEAASKFKQSLMLNSKNPQAFLGLGITYQEMGEIEKAEQAFLDAIELQPLFAVAHVNLGALYVNIGRIDDGIAKYKETIEINPYFPQAHYNLAIALRKLGRNREALESYLTAIKLQPAYVAARINAGILYAERKKIDLAIEQFKEVLRYDPDNGRALSALKQLGAF
ncbi:MAG: tetratricopeptide repeat protein [Candidatus Peribacter sp.]|jgi:protein O-mannosyl-transferase|nr:tetratricopeptide repeat protein [Candidatus Peribacter sp.]MBT4393045.1 tetratricopeptide repeat protein [Candidatus Peribacter sp.]MBT4600396.1 tetratricopeptide repeat protein [Candidatus Peribacter sp.]MBT5149354.1 tetratricopeptide repeat protein [Candidatus Peribacter sp.]MBT5637583.1 tetratricopeptide repeat protein [Candidatus Peribacter sp.]